jgi:hypothetical protein
MIDPKVLRSPHRRYWSEIIGERWGVREGGDSRIAVRKRGRMCEESVFKVIQNRMRRRFEELINDTGKGV